MSDQPFPQGQDLRAAGALCPIRVASVPASHVYVRHVASVGDLDAVVRLPDPPPKDGRKVPGGWWPPVMLDRTWLVEHASEFDVLHIQFGFDTKTPQELAEIADCLCCLGKPLIYTVHDLRNPHHTDRRGHDDQLDVLIPAATELLTITAGAAHEIWQRWGRRPQVVPHPHVVDLGALAVRRRPPRNGRFVVGVHVKSLRANMDPVPVIDAIASVLDELPGARLQIDVHDEIFDSANHWYAPDVGRDLVSHGNHPKVDVRVHPYMTDDQLWDYLAGIDVSVLPYRFGTHSGWLEACADLGTTVVAPDCGYYAEQRRVHSYHLNEEQFDEGSLADAVRSAYHAESGYQTSVAERRLERFDIARAHRAIYERALLQ